jgi:hypothetical protein
MGPAIQGFGCRQPVAGAAAADWLSGRLGARRSHRGKCRRGLTAAIVINDLAKATETGERVEAAWINSSGRHIGPLYGGWKQSGIGEEECFDEIGSYR